MDAKLVSVQIATPPFPLNPFVGQVWLNWIWNGSVWVCQGQGAFQTIRKFTASGVYVPSAGLTYAVVECIGGGGAGGNATGLGNVFSAAGGGGSGGYSKSVIPVSLLQGSIPVTVAGFGTIGAQGGSTSFGALVVANGGGPGGVAGGPSFGPGGQRALPGVGDIAFPGAPGGSGLYSIAGNAIMMSGGLGGQIIGGNPTSPAGGALVNGASGDPNTGAGGGGAFSNAAPSGSAFGGSGASGLCIVTEFGLGPTALADLTPPPVEYQLCDANGNPVR